jgi:hypothetical protein
MIDAIQKEYGFKQGLDIRGDKIEKWPYDVAKPTAAKIKLLKAEGVKLQEAEKDKADLKLSGIEFEGVMCSAKSKDMWGLSAIDNFIRSGNSVSFRFENGNSLALTPANLDAFQSVWVPFRASFFPLAKP